MARIEFSLFGPLLVSIDGEIAHVPHGKQRTVLAALLLKANRVISLDELAETLWGHEPPPSASVSVQNYVMRLRKALGPEAGARISTQARGYLIRVDPEELDLSRFEVHLRAARAAARKGRWAAAAAEAGAGLALWRGEPLADADSELLSTRDVPRLAELRLQALEIRIEADLQLSRHADVIGELRELTASNPLRERLHGLLMLALYRDGRQAEALAVFRAARQTLIEELGAEPGPELRELHRQILAADPALTGPATAAPTGEPAAARKVPQELPAPVGHFIGQAAELDTLTALLGRSGGMTPEAVVISAIGGTAGVGKTALAVHWAHQIADRFPDGQLYVNLRGYDPGRPMAPADALARFLRALGLQGQDIPPDPDERASRYRSLLAGQRMLVILDNAGSAEQVRPLLPGAPTSMVVVTSRDSLAGLIARDGATRLDLDLMPLDDAVRLLRALIGTRVEADPGATAALAVQCSRLPLALRVAAELASARPGCPVADLVAELADQQKRLDQLDAAGDPRTAVRTVFSWSYQHLDADCARTFRLVGLQPGTDFECCAVAAAAGISLERARQLLAQLTRAHLIQRGPGNRYGLHDLLRAYARDLALMDVDEARAAQTRLFDHYLHAAATAMDTLYPAEGSRRPRIPTPDRAVLPPVTTTAGAQAWLDAQRGTLVAAAEQMVGAGWPRHAVLLSQIVYRYLFARSYHGEAVAIHTLARGAARQTGDRAGEANALNGLASADYRQGRHEQAIGYFEQALVLFGRAGDVTGQARALTNVGLVQWELGHYEQATDTHRQALALFRQMGERVGEAGALNNLGNCYEHQGKYECATQYFRQAVVLYRECGHLLGEANAVGNLGIIAERQGRLEQAAEQQRLALTLSRKIGNLTAQATALDHLGLIAFREGRCGEAIDYRLQALAVYQANGERSGEADARNGLGQVYLAVGQPDSARAQHTAALALVDPIGSRHQQAGAHHGLGDVCSADGDQDQARRHWLKALAIYASIGAPEADVVRARLDGLSATVKPEGQPCPPYRCSSELVSWLAIVSRARTCCRCPVRKDACCASSSRSCTVTAGPAQRAKTAAQR